jgi:uncharacterized protein (TIGR00661 family)
MRILYGVVGEGMGHAMRSRVVLEHLVASGHEVHVMTSGRAVDFLRRRFEGHANVSRIHGMHIAYDDNRVLRTATFWQNLLAGTAALPKQIAAYFDLMSSFRAEAVISDFESWTYYYARNHRLPILSIDNMQLLNRCTLDAEIIEQHRAEFRVAKALVKAKLPFCNHYLITTFFQLPVRKPETSLFPPILRPEIVEQQSRRGEHLLIYQTAEGYDSLLDTLRRIGLECRIYGMRRDLTDEVVDGNLRFRPFSEPRFIEDLASARGVVAGGGFTLMGEAVYLKKPMLAVPVRGQFEQIANARYLEKLGYGRYAPDLRDPARLFEFVAGLPAHEEKLASYQQDGNRELFRCLDAKLAEIGS